MPKRLPYCLFFFVKALLIAGLLTSVHDSFSQSDSTHEVRLSGFVDAFYAFDFNTPSGSRQPFLFNHNRHNEFNINMALLQLDVSHSRYRAVIALQAGTYAIDNYAEEPGLLSHLFEAYAGVSLNKKGNIWLDAGIFSSHLGFESALSIENPTLTRSLAAENSPYYLSGTRLTYAPAGKWQASLLVVNGWQRIQRVSGNSLPSLGTQVTYTPNDRIQLNWSTFMGTDDPDSTRRMRYFNNLYGQFQLTKRLFLITGFDIGIQQQTKGSTRYNTWLTPVLIARYTIHEQWAIAARAEYYQDREGIIVSDTPGGFRTTGFSLNADYAPAPGVACRLEGRWFISPDRPFVQNDRLTGNNFFLAGSIAIQINNRISR